jgi:hypothetical protein
LDFFLHLVHALFGQLSVLATFGQTEELTWLILMARLRSYGDGMEWKMRVMHAKVIYSGKITQNDIGERKTRTE